MLGDWRDGSVAWNTYITLEEDPWLVFSAHAGQPTTTCNSKLTLGGSNRDPHGYTYIYINRNLKKKIFLERTKGFVGKNICHMLGLILSPRTHGEKRQPVPESCFLTFTRAPRPTHTCIHTHFIHSPINKVNKADLK